jgi:50S ribosomal protein L16 3-hydroxylase
MHHAIDAGDETNAFLANFISRYRLAHQPAPPEHAIDADELSRQLSAGSRLLRNPWTRLVWVEWDGKARLFAAGEEFSCSIKAAEALNSMPPILPDKSVENLELITALINSGHFYLQSPGPAWPAVGQD